MHRALVPIDGSDNALSSIRHVIKLIRGGEPLEVHLLNVQPPLRGDVTTFVSASAVRDFHREEAEKALALACRLLDETGIRYVKHIIVGHAAEIIARTAKELRCDKVVMGTRGLGTVTQLLLGSVSHKAIHQMDPHIPITLVKAGYELPAPRYQPATGEPS